MHQQVRASTRMYCMSTSTQGTRRTHLSSSSFQRHAEQHSLGGVGVTRVLALCACAAPADADAVVALALRASRSYTTRAEYRMSTRRLNSSSVRRLRIRRMGYSASTVSSRIRMRALMVTVRGALATTTRQSANTL